MSKRGEKDRKWFWGWWTRLEPDQLSSSDLIVIYILAGHGKRTKGQHQKQANTEICVAPYLPRYGTLILYTWMEHTIKVLHLSDIFYPSIGTACWRNDYTTQSSGIRARSDARTFRVFSFEELQIVARKWSVAWIDQGWFGQDLRLDQALKRLNFLWNESIVGHPRTLAFQCQYHLIHHPVSRADASTWSFLSLWAGNDQVMIRPIAKVGDKANTGDNKWYTWTMDYNAR